MMIMKRTISILISILCAFSASAQTPSAREAIEADPLKAGGVYALYDFADPELTPAPKGYTPFYISHYGRHGARYIEFQGFNDKVLNLFANAERDGKLTPYGKDLYARVQAHYDQTRHHVGDLSEKGWEQHKRIAQRIGAAYPEVFGAGTEVSASSTLLMRCAMSMSSFCLSLKDMYPGLRITESASVSTLDELNPHAKLNPHYRGVDPNDGKMSYLDPWGGCYLTFGREHVAYEAILGRIFTSMDYLRTLGEPLLFVSDLYNFIMNAQDTDTGVDMMDAFLPSELYGLWEWDNYWYWLTFGGDRYTDMPVLEHFLDRCEEDMALGRPFVRLRFGHDSIVIALLTMLKADGMGRMPESADAIPEVFRSYEIPMASTLYFVFYRNRAGDVIFKLVHNDREVTLPLQSVSGKYYRWDDLRSSCRDLVAAARAR